MTIKYGSTQYFGLLDFQDKINYRGYEKFDLVTLDKLRAEVEIKIKAINLEHKNSQPPK